MARILSVSYDETLLRTRELMLKGVGYKVTSAFGNHECQIACRKGGSFDLLIMGHSIPKKDKLDMIRFFRGFNPNALVIALTRAGESRLVEVDAYLNPGDPEELIRAVSRTLNPLTDRRHAA